MIHNVDNFQSSISLPICTLFRCLGSDQLFRRLTFVGVTVTHELTILFESLAVVVFWHYAHTPAAFSDR